MLLRTYKKMTEEFHKHKGYMSFSELKAVGITILQIREMEEEGILVKFARGFYWCNDCGYERPYNHKYIELAKVNPKAVICMESAAFLNGMIELEPECICVATSRTDRKKMEFEFPIHRFYFQNANLEGEIQTIKTEFGDFKVYSQERTICDCMRMKEQIDSETYFEIEQFYRSRQEQLKRVRDYAKVLRALKNVEL